MTGYLGIVSDLTSQTLLVSDNLKTYTKGAFYEIFAPTQARSVVRRLEYYHTPKHGSWLNIAEGRSSSRRPCN